MLMLNQSVAVDVTATSGLTGSAVMLIVQNEVMTAFPDLETYRIPNPDPLPQEPGPNGVFVQAAAMDWLGQAAPANWENPWTLFYEV